MAQDYSATKSNFAATGEIKKNQFVLALNCRGPEQGHFFTFTYLRCLAKNLATF